MLSAEPAIARVQPASPTSLFLMGVAAGRTTIVATSDSGAPIVQYDVTVTARPRAAAPVQAAPAPAPAPAPPDPDAVGAAAAAQAEALIRRTVPGGSGLRATAAGGRLLRSGTVATAAAGEQAEATARGVVGDKAAIVATYTVLGSIQVNVRVRIAEVSRTIERQLGFNWQILSGGNNWRFGTLTGAGATANTTASGVTATGIQGLSQATLGGLPFAYLNPQFPIGGGANQIGAGFRSGSTDVNGIIDALATDNLVTILAEPNLTAQSGEAASFLAGGEFPVPVAASSSNGSPTISVSFKQFGVSLEVVPTVLSAGRVNLRIRPEVSQLSATGSVSVPIAGGSLTIPALSVRRAETTVELGSGQSFAIAGLLQRTSSDATSALPGMGEIPVIGALFKSNTFQRGESELVIIVTPYLVRPVSAPDQLRLPTDGIRAATNLDRILLGRQLRQTNGAPLDAGFILK